MKFVLVTYLLLGPTWTPASMTDADKEVLKAQIPYVEYTSLKECETYAAGLKKVINDRWHGAGKVGQQLRDVRTVCVKKGATLYKFQES